MKLQRRRLGYGGVLDGPTATPNNIFSVNFLLHSQAGSRIHGGYQSMLKVPHPPPGCLYQPIPTSDLRIGYSSTSSLRRNNVYLMMTHSKTIDLHDLLFVPESDSQSRHKAVSKVQFI